MLPVSRPSIGMEELEQVKKVFGTGWLGLGSTVYEFENKLKEWKITPNTYQEFVLDNGLGDHLIFKSLLPKIYEKYKDSKIILYV